MVLFRFEQRLGLRIRFRQLLNQPDVNARQICIETGQHLRQILGRNALGGDDPELQGVIHCCLIELCNRIAHLGNLLLGCNDGDAVHKKICLNERLVGLVLLNKQCLYLVSHGIGISVFKHDIVDCTSHSLRLGIQHRQEIRDHRQIVLGHQYKQTVGFHVRPSLH